jgi:uncharacterized damage-inducible protein DinB
VRSGEVSAYLISVLSDEVWRAEPPSERGRTIAATTAHMLSVRRMFARMGGVKKTGGRLDQGTITRARAIVAFRASTDGLAEAFQRAFRDHRARVKGQPRRAVDMLSYLIQHDAHHRGQICSLARALGHDFAPKDIARMWGWSKLP